MYVSDPDGDLASATIGITPPGYPGPTVYSMSPNKPGFPPGYFFTLYPGSGWSTSGYVHYVITVHDTDGNSASIVSNDAPWTGSTGNSVYFMSGGCIF